MAEPTFGDATVLDAGTDGTDTSNYDVGSGTDRTYVGAIGIYDDSFTDPITVDTWTYDGSTVTTREISEHQYAGGGRTVKVWIGTLDNPTSGSNSRVATLSEGNNDMFVYDAYWTGANNGVGSNTAETQGNTADHEYDITGTDADGMHLQAGMNQATRTLTAGTGTTIRAEDNESGTGDSRSWLASESSSGGTDTVGITFDSSARSASCIIELLPTAGGVATVVKDVVGGGIIPFER